MVDFRVGLLKNMKLVYVEDDAEIVEAVRFSFSDLFCGIEFYKTAEEALDGIKNNLPDMIITDICLPYMNGIEFTKLVKEQHPDIPVMIISGYKEANMLLDSIDARVDCYMTKPVNLRMLKQNLYKLAESTHNRRIIENGTRLISRVLDNSRELYMSGDSHGVTYMNATMLELLGFSGVEEARKATHVNCGIKIVENNSKDREISFKKWIEFVRHMDGYESLVSIMCPGKLKSDARSFIARVSRVKEDNSYIVSFVDVTVIERQKQFFHNLAMKDPLTEVYNRIKFTEEIQRETIRNRRYGTGFSVIMFDIDKFKHVNDTCGHQVGDSVLKELAALISENIRTTDIFARYGGEEFIIITPEVRLDGASQLAEKLRKIAEDHDFEHAGNLTCSFGVAEHEKQMSADELIRRADEALYRAKAEGRNRVIS